MKNYYSTHVVPITYITLHGAQKPSYFVSNRKFWNILEFYYNMNMSLLGSRCGVHFLPPLHNKMSKYVTSMQNLYLSGGGFKTRRWHGCLK